MIKAALSPVRENNSFVIIRMDELFDEYNDKKTNGENNYLAVNTKSEVYESYIEDIKLFGWNIM